MGRLLRWLPVAVARAVLPEPPFECDNARCRVRPRATIYAAALVCAPGNYTCASCCDPDPNCRCGAGASGHSTAPTANATAVRLHLHAAFPDRAAQLAALSDAQAVEAFKGLAWRTPRCPAGYYECAGCCDRDADCACDGACDLGTDADCALAYGAGGAKPDGWCPVRKSTSVSGAPDNSSLSHSSAMKRPTWLGRAARNRHRAGVASMAWRTTRRFRTNAR